MTHKFNNNYNNENPHTNNANINPAEKLNNNPYAYQYSNKMLNKNNIFSNQELYRQKPQTNSNSKSNNKNSKNPSRQGLLVNNNTSKDKKVSKNNKNNLNSSNNKLNNSNIHNNSNSLQDSMISKREEYEQYLNTISDRKPQDNFRIANEDKKYLRKDRNQKYEKIKTIEDLYKYGKKPIIFSNNNNNLNKSNSNNSVGNTNKNASFKPSNDRCGSQNNFFSDAKDVKDDYFFGKYIRNKR